MKKCVFLAAAMACLSFVAPAQEPQEDFNGWGVRVGLDLNFPGNWNFGNGNSVEMFRPGAGFTAGVVYNLPLVSNLYFEPGLSMFYDTYSYKDLIVTDDSGVEADRDPSIKKFGFRLPLMWGYRFGIGGFNFALFTGPEFSYAVTGKLGFKDAEVWGDGLDDNLFGSDKANRRFDVGWKIGVGFPIGRWYCGVDGTFGLLDLHKNDASFHENRVTVSIGYDF